MNMWERLRYSRLVVYVECAWMWLYRKYDDWRTPRPVWETERADVPRETSTD